MNTNLKIQESLKLKKKALALLSKAIAKIILKFRLPRSEFINSLDENLVLQAKKQDPEASNVSIAIRTGIHRRYINKHLRGEMPESKPDKLAIILEDIHWTAHKFYGGKKIPKTGPFRTFQSICEQRASGTLTYNAILEEMLKNGNLIDLGNKVELINLMPSTMKNDVAYSQTTANQINRIVSTIIFNSEIKDNEDTFVQRTVFSTQINPTKFNSLHKDIKQKTQSFRNEINELMADYEEDVNTGTYPEYGYSFLEYKIEK
ncbi:MAG: hypothetical protein L3J83_03205 [Proteobacteria bacterium]|nr:hypothetical protein [Pseudomonadota bacterium]